MWLAIELSIVALGFVLVVIAGFATWGRWKRMHRAGGRFADRVGSLSVSAGLLADRLQMDDRASADD